MKINSIDNYRIQPSMQAGLYFSKTSNVIFNKNANYKTEEIVKLSQEGFKYIEDTKTPQIIKEKFAKIPFIKNLAEKFDTFIFFREIPKGAYKNFDNFSYTKISWGDTTKKMAEIRRAEGNSPISQTLATEKMFKNIEKETFVNI